MTSVPWWQRPFAPLLVIVLGVLLHAQALRFGFLADDWGQELVLEQPIPGATMQPWSLYDFGTRADVERALSSAVLPWWTDPGWKARFFRPLSSLVLWGEHALFGRAAVPRHALGLLWQAAFLALAWRLFGALGLTRGTALLALALLACEDGAVMSVGWFANRNSLVEGVATAAAFLCALRARGAGRAREVALALLCGALAFGAKESGLAAWLGCAALWWGVEEPHARRGRSLALALALLAIVFLRVAGYGTVSLFYPTPWGDPLRYARHLAGLLSGALPALLGPFPLDALEMVPGAFWPLVLLAVLALALLRRPLAAACARTPHAPALLAFAAASLAIQACALPSDRLLFVPALALAPLAAGLLVELRQGSTGWRRLGLVLGLTAVPLSAVLLVLRGALIASASRGLAQVFAEAELERAPGGRREVLLLSGPTVLAMLAPQAGWRFTTGELETEFHVLQMVRRGLRLRRLDERTLEVESLDGPFLSTPFEGVFLGPGGPPAVGEVRSTGAFEIERLSAERLRVHGRSALEADPYRVLAWGAGRWRAVTLPPVGGVAELPAPEPISVFLP